MKKIIFTILFCVIASGLFAESYTSKYGYAKPTVNGDTGLWGAFLNNNADTLDAKGTPYTKGDSCYISMNFNVISASGFTTTTSTSYADRAFFCLDWNASKYQLTNTDSYYIEFGAIGKGTGTDTLWVKLYNITTDTELLGTELSFAGTTLQSKVIHLPLSLFPSVSNILSVQTKSGAGASVSFGGMKLRLVYRVK